MTRGCTPTIICRLPVEVNLDLADNVYVTLSQKGRRITKSGTDLDVSGSSVSVWLAQQDSLYFRDVNDTVGIQVNWTYLDGNRGATKIKEIRLDPNLLPEVLA